jgi:hypothetical protein
MHCRDPFSTSTLRSSSFTSSLAPSSTSIGSWIKST